jgi:hypothetical protein
MDDAPAKGSKSKEPHQKNKRGKKGKKPRREAREQGGLGRRSASTDQRSGGTR